MPLYEIYEKTTKKMLFPDRAGLIADLKKDSKCDILIIGGGIQGATLAHLASFNGLKVVLLEKNDYAGLKKPCRLKGTNDGRYILVYMMEKNEELIALANKISKETGLPIAQRSYEKIFDNETELLYEHDPAEFLSVIENAEFVLTNSFHGTALSAIFEKPFLSMLHSTTGLRVTDLLKKLGLEDNSLRQKKEELKEKGLKFLKESLNVGI